MPPQTPDMTERPNMVLDIDRLQQNCNGNRDIVAELLKHLCQISGPKWILAIEKGVREGDGETVREVCHGMKGACATIFAWRLSNLAFEFEYLARDGDMASLEERMGELGRGFVEIKAWIRENF